jgi:ribose 5-phosphate isomerase A
VSLRGVPSEPEERAQEKQQAADRAEVIPFGRHSQKRFIESLGARVIVRQQPDGTPFTTDQGNLIFDCAFGPIREPAALAAQLDARTGIVEHGLFLGLATEVIVAGADGIRHLTPKKTER